MLQGTFETLSLPEVLGLLAGARKSGALWLEAGPVSGVVHLTDGHCHAADSIEQHGPLDDGGDLLMRLVDLCFTSMCQPSGSFRFAADEPAPWSCPEPVELSDALVEVDRLLKQWREILRVIPSLDCRVRARRLEVDELVIDREGWALLVAIDGRRTVRELVQRTGRPVIDVCQALLELVDAGALGVIDPAAALASGPPSRRRWPKPAPSGTSCPAPPARASGRRSAPVRVRPPDPNASRPVRSVRERSRRDRTSAVDGDPGDPEPAAEPSRRPGRHRRFRTRHRS